MTNTVENDFRLIFVRVIEKIKGGRFVGHGVYRVTIENLKPAINPAAVFTLDIDLFSPSNE